MRKLTLEEIKERLKEINPNIKIIDGEYTNRNSILKCKCLIDGYEWDTSWGSLRSCKLGCPKCGIEFLSQKQKLTIDEIRIRLKIINPDVEILTSKYVNAHDKLKCRCKIDGHKWSVTWGKLQSGRGCPECRKRILSDKFSYTIEEIKDKLSKTNPNIEILSTEYKNSSTKLKCRCMKDGHEWITTWKSLGKGSGCPVCGLEAVSGENSCRWKGGISKLREYLRARIQEWKTDSINFCKNKCIITGEEFDAVHHLYGFDKILEETLNETQIPLYEEINQYSNAELRLLEDTCLKLHYKHGLGVCLTKEIHEEFHNMYGYGSNTKEQFEEFKKIKSKQINNKTKAS